MRKTILLPTAVTACSLFINGLAAQDSTISFSGRLQYDHVSYFNKQQNKINGRNEGFLQVALDSKTKQATRWRTAIEVREDMSDKSRNRIWLDELWVKHRMGFADFTFGKQILTWGTADGFNPVDNVNPIDYSDLLDTDDEKIGVYAMRAQLFCSSADIDIIWTPAGSYGKLPGVDSRWFPSLAMMGVPPPLSSAISGISVDEQNPDLTLDDGEAGARFRKRFRGFDLAISYYNGLDHLPEFRVDSSRLIQPEPELVLISEFYRQQVTGFEWVAALPYGMSIRGEAAFFVPEKNRPNRNKYIHAIAGVDRTFPIGTGSLMAVVEYIHDFRVTGEKYSIFDTRHIFRNTLFANLELTLNNGFTFNATSIFNLDSNDYLLRPEIHYLTTNGIKFTFRADILEGCDNSFLGSFSFNDRAQFKVTYTF